MSAELDPLARALGSVCDGSPLDWDATLRDAEPAMRPRVAALREIARIGAFNRELQLAGEQPAAAARWGDLLLLERLGRGAQAEVYRAWDPQLQRDVALKLLSPRAGAAAPAIAISPLLEEGRAMARLRHPHIATVHGIDNRDGRVGLWMELVRGRPLDRHLEGRRPYSASDAARLGAEIGAALVAVHEAGLLHRDVKPGNVMRDEQGRHVLTDFGLGLPRDGASAPAVSPSGTPLYMAPEVLAGGPPSVQADIYGFGMLLWFALTGRQPFAARDLDDLRAAAARGPAPGLGESRPDLPPALVALVEQAIAPDPDARPASLAPLVEALRSQDLAPPAGAVADRNPRPRRTLPRFITVVTGLAAVVAIVLLAARPDRIARDRFPAALAFSVEATFLRRDATGATRLAAGDRIAPGDQLCLALRASRPLWVYVVNEDERGNTFLLFPQPLFDLRNPLPADSTLVLPGPIDGRENAWLVTSAGGREHFLVVACADPVPEFEADLRRLPAPVAGRPPIYAALSDAAIGRLRGLGGLVELPPGAVTVATAAPFLTRFRDLVVAEAEARGIWIRHFYLENPL